MNHIIACKGRIRTGLTGLYKPVRFSKEKQLRMFCIIKFVLSDLLRDLNTMREI
jgi:hypothetical protein